MRKPIFIKTIIFLLCFMRPVFTQDKIAVQSAFIPIYQHFNFEEGKIVDSDHGDITISDYGIETTQSESDIARLHKGFIEDIKELPQEKDILWSDFADYSLDMIYAVKRVNDTYGTFELINVKMSGDEVIGVEIEYKYQPDGSRNF